MKEERHLRGLLARSQTLTKLNSQLMKTDPYRITLASAHPNKLLSDILLNCYSDLLLYFTCS